MLKIKELCKSKGISMAELAKKIGVTPSALSQNISGNPNLDRLKEIADALNVPIQDLFGNTGLYGLIQYNGQTYKIDSVEALRNLLKQVEDNGTKAE